MSIRPIVELDVVVEDDNAHRAEIWFNDRMTRAEWRSIAKAIRATLREYDSRKAADW